jgi:hypothetical protein
MENNIKNQVKKGTLLLVKSSRKGTYKAIALRDFDLRDEWYPVALAETDKSIVGMNPSNIWIPGDEVPCRASLCTVTFLTQ